MNNPTKTRRMPVKYRVHPGGITEICYSATPQAIIANEPLPAVLLPGTRWLEKRRAREQRLASAQDETALAPLPCLTHESLADRISATARRLAGRQATWLSSLRGAQADLELSPQN